MKLFTADQRARMKRNYLANQAAYGERDFWPVVKLFMPDGGATWLLSEYDEDTETAFGLCDLGLGFPELGYVSVAELREIRGKLGLPVERDRHFKAQCSLSKYADAARHAERVVA